MDSMHGKCSLYLIPKQPDFAIEDISSLVTTLQDIGLISQEINQHDNNSHYYSGERYLDYVAYMGCAPSIQFEADADNNEDFCFIKLHQYEKPELIVSRTQSRAPHCPVCQKPVKDWQDSKTGTAIRCNLCHTSSDIERYNWRKMAGYARLFIEITDIFPKEAIPQQLLLGTLSEKLGTDWLYFYACH